jgi:hypothetical protein
MLDKPLSQLNFMAKLTSTRELQSAKQEQKHAEGRTCQETATVYTMLTSAEYGDVLVLRTNER